MESTQKHSGISRSFDESYKLNLYPLDNEYLGVLNISKLPPKLSKAICETVIILDRSGSMNTNVEYIIEKILPAFFDQLNYKPDDAIHLITFDSNCEYFKLKVEDFKKLGIRCQGCTNMSGAIKKLSEIMEEFKADKVEAVRILTVSDGDISDQKLTAKLSDELVKSVKKTEIKINSQAVRFFTSYAEPDTTALCCLLQLNNVIESNLLDISSTAQINVIIEKWAELFKNDGLINGVELECDSGILRRNPWDTIDSNKIHITTGNNVFWVKTIPNSAKIIDIDVKISVEPQMSYEKFHQILNKKLNVIVDKMKILKIIQTDDGRKTMNDMVDYFKRVEKTLPDPQPINVPENRSLLSSRTSLFKLNAVNQRKISYILAEIANDDEVSSLNAAQKASYLRSTTVSKNSRSLAKRSARATGDENFDEIAMKEILQIVEHFDEIKDIDYKNHSVSFYSQATTMEGIKTLVEFSQDEYFKTIDVFEIIELMNIVGVACNGPIGDFPDASTWRVNKMFPGCFISLSDLMHVLDQSPDNKLKPPGFDDEITNVIPVFDDPRIAKFLKKYAPSILEFTFSIGMRRMIAEIPMTITYTMISGIRGILPVINENKSSVNLEILSKFVSALDNFAGKSMIQDLINNETSVSTLNGFFLDNSGISDLIVPLIRVIKSNDENLKKKIPAILRSIFSYEVFNVIRKKYKGIDGESKSMLHKLLGIDVEKHKVKVELPMDEENVKLYDEINLDLKFFESLTSNLGFINFIALIPKLFEAVIKINPDAIKSAPQLDEKLVLESLEIENCEFSDFMLLNVYQALRYTTKQERCDVNEKSMLILDLKNHLEAKDEIKSYIRGVFEAEYKRDLANAKGLTRCKDRLLKDSYYFEENLKKELQKTKKYSYDIEAEKLVMKILSTSSYDEMILTWKEGIKINEKYVKLSSVGSSATRIFILALRCLHFKIPLRSEIIEILTTGKDSSGNEIWKNDTLKEGTVIAKYIKFVNYVCEKFPAECIKDVKEVQS